MTSRPNDPVALLCHSRAQERRRAARRLRADPQRRAGPALLQALREEVERNPGGWETQHHLALALIECGDADALPFLTSARDRRDLRPMARMALAEASVALNPDPAAELTALATGDDADLRTGALRAGARHRVVLDEDQARKVQGACPCPTGADEDWPCLYLVIAAARWPDGVKGELVSRCRSSPWPQLRDAAELAARGEYAEVPVL